MTENFATVNKNKNASFYTKKLCFCINEAIKAVKETQTGFSRADTPPVTVTAKAQKNTTHSVYA